MVISPHCDDAVFGCGELLAARPGSTVVTVFAGRPAVGAPLTAWDAAAGFAPGDDVMERRRQEDRTALARLGARARWLSFRDAQYGGPLNADTVVEALADAVLGSQPEIVAMPLGLFHDDHKTAHEAGLRLARRRPRLAWILYADALYRTLPGLVDERLTALRRDGLEPVEFPPSATPYRPLKERAVGCYASQLRALVGAHGRNLGDLYAPERYWIVKP